MSRTAWFCACTAWALGVACAARADDMDLALSRLRIGAMDETCQALTGGVPERLCPDQEMFERLVSELSVAMAPPVISPARTIGPRGFQLSLSTALTSIESGQLYWRRGTEGDPPDEPPSSEIGGNDDVQSLQAWTYLQARKGLPFGFELALLLGQGMNTSMWTVGGALKWALFEGFRTGLGQLPDVALQAALNRSVGSSQATVQLFTMDLVVSKSLVIEHTFTVAPLLGLQWLVADVESDVIDLTPGGEPAGELLSGDAYGRCRPNPGQMPGRIACAQGGTDADFANSVMFEPVQNDRLRMFLGGNLRFEPLTVTLALLFDLTSPDLEAEAEHLDSQTVAHQVAFNMTVGAVLE